MKKTSHFLAALFASAMCMPAFSAFAAPPGDASHPVNAAMAKLGTTHAAARDVSPVSLIDLASFSAPRSVAVLEGVGLASRLCRSAGGSACSGLTLKSTHIASLVGFTPHGPAPHQRM